MASFDSNGERIKTDILVFGYIRNVMNECKIEIPDEIVRVCFLFWFMNVCDQWDKALCHHGYVDIDESCAKLNDEYKNSEFTSTDWCCTLFGTQSVRNGVFKWHVQFNANIGWICIGIIKDTQDAINANKTNNEYGKRAGDGCFLYLFHSNNHGYLYYDDQIDWNYCDSIEEANEGTIIEITLDIDNHTIKYKLNKKEYKAVQIKSLSAENGYRLAVTLVDTGCTIELL